MDEAGNASNSEEILDEQVSADETKQSEQPEKMLPVSRVNQLVGEAKAKGARKMQEKLEALEAQLAQMQQPQQQPQVGMGGQAPVDQEQITRQILENVQRQMQEQQQQQEQARLQQEADRIAQAFYTKMEQGKEKFDDFDSVIADFNPSDFPALVLLANEADNTADIIYELRKNPSKLATLATLVERSPQLARGEIGRISQSIKDNMQAKTAERETQEPLSRIKPSMAGADTDVKSVRDFKKAPWLRA